MVESTDPCIFDVLSIQQIDTLIQRYAPIKKTTWRRAYTNVKRLYTDVCSNCQNLKPGDTSEEISLLRNIENFLNYLVLNVAPIMKESTEMKNAMTLMLCKRKRCVNHDTWGAMDTSFMNWLSHRTSQMGHMRLGIDDRELMRLGGSNYAEILVKVRKFMYEKNIQNMYDYESLEFAQTCYAMDFKAREVRYPQQVQGLFVADKPWGGKWENKSICGEKLCPRHTFRKNLARALDFVLAELIEQLESD